jgi:hypothetical protein
MKGVVFTEFIEMVESDFGFETVDRIIEAADTSTQGCSRPLAPTRSLIWRRY